MWRVIRLRWSTGLRARVALQKQQLHQLAQQGALAGQISALVHMLQSGARRDQISGYARAADYTRRSAGQARRWLMSSSRGFMRRWNLPAMPPAARSAGALPARCGI